jgi:hypothetical protein
VAFGTGKGEGPLGRDVNPREGDNIFNREL